MWGVENSPLIISLIHTHLLISYCMLGNIPITRNIAENEGPRPHMQLIIW